MTPRKKVFLSFLAVLACFAAGAFWIWQGKWQQPLGPVLQLETATPFRMPATWTPDSQSIKALQSASTVVPLRTASPAPTQTLSTGLCGGPAVMNLLAIGADTRGNNYLYGLADVIRLVRVDFVTPKVTILEIPRDLWVEIPDIADNLSGQDHEKLNQAYLYGNPGMKYTNDPAQGPGLLARTLTLNFGTRLDHYAAVNMRTFEKIVNAVGGIEVALPEAVDGRTADDRNKRLFFPAGTHLLNGQQALMLARIRISGGFARAENQNRVLCALREKLTSPEVVTQIPGLIQAFQGAVQTDLSPEQLSQLACLGTQLPAENVIFATFPAEHFKQTRIYDPVFKKKVSIWDVDFEILREYIQQFQAGSWPAPAAVQVEPSEKEVEASFCP